MSHAIDVPYFDIYSHLILYMAKTLTGAEKAVQSQLAMNYLIESGPVWRLRDASQCTVSSRWRPSGLVSIKLLWCTLYL